MSKLNDIRFFSALSDEDIKELDAFARREDYLRKALIFSEGDPSEWFYFVLEGKVKITKLSQDGKEIILELIQPDSAFGAVAVLRGFPYPANAVAMEDSKVLKIARGDLMKIIDRFPDVMNSLIRDMGDRIKESHETMKNIALEKVGSRIAALLLKLSRFYYKLYLIYLHRS